MYIYFSQEQIAGLMGCGVKKVRCLLKELDDRKGIGLITRVRQGLGNPDRIYVKKCVSPERFKENFQTADAGQRFILRLGIVAVPVISIGAAYILIKRKYIIDERKYEELVEEIKSTNKK